MLVSALPSMNLLGGGQLSVERLSCTTLKDRRGVRGGAGSLIEGAIVWRSRKAGAGHISGISAMIGGTNHALANGTPALAIQI